MLFDGDDATTRSARDRRVGFVFQHYALFRHMSVFENVAFGLRVRPRALRRPKARFGERSKTSWRWCSWTIWANAPRRSCPVVSVSASRSRARWRSSRGCCCSTNRSVRWTPKVRQELRRWLRRLHAEIHLTSVFVTHDQEEALELANRVIVMNEGRIEQDGTPDEVVEHPATPFVVNFLGNVNIFHGRVQDGKALLGPLAIEYPDHPHTEVRTAVGYARPHELDISRTDEGGGLWATVTDVRTSGGGRETRGQRPGRAIQCKWSSDASTTRTIRAIIGERVYVKPRKVRVFMSNEIHAK